MTDDAETAEPAPELGGGKWVKLKSWLDSRPHWMLERLEWCNTNRASLVVLILIGVVASLVFRILFSSVRIGSPSTESDALVRSSERLIQLVQWTLSTVLIIGGGLIGLNWYSNEHRYRKDKVTLNERFNRMERLRRADFTSSIEERIDVQKQILEVKFDLHQLTDQIASTMLMVDGRMPSDGYVKGALDLIRQPLTSSIIKERTLDNIAGMFEREGSATSFTAYLGLDTIPDLADEAEKQGFGGHAARLGKRYLELRPPAGK